MIDFNAIEIVIAFKVWLTFSRKLVKFLKNSGLQFQFLMLKGPCSVTLQERSILIGQISGGKTGARKSSAEKLV